MSQIGDGALTPEQKKDLQNRLARVEGQLRGVQKLIAIAQEPSDCAAAAQQLAAARKALERAFAQLLVNGARTQGAQARDLPQAKAAMEQLAQLLDKYL